MKPFLQLSVKCTLNLSIPCLYIGTCLCIILYIYVPLLISYVAMCNLVQKYFYISVLDLFSLRVSDLMFEIVLSSAFATGRIGKTNLLKLKAF